MADCSKLSLILNDMSMSCADNNPSMSFNDILSEINESIEEAGGFPVTSDILSEAISEVSDFKNRTRMESIVELANKISSDKNFPPIRIPFGPLRSSLREIVLLDNLGQLSDLSPSSLKKIDKAINNLDRRSSKGSKLPKDTIDNMKSLSSLLNDHKDLSKQSLAQKHASKKLERLEVDQTVFKRNVDRKIESLEPKPLLSYLAEPFNLSKGIMSGLDLSGTLYQGGILSASHPINFSKAFWRSLQAFYSKDLYDKRMAELMGHDLFEYSQTRGVGLSLTDVKTNQREDWMRSHIADHIPLIAGSNRAFSMFLNSMRMNVFSTLVSSLNRHGNFSESNARAIAYFINTATGRSPGEYTERGIAPKLMWSAQLTASRFKYALGIPLWKAALSGKDFRHPIVSKMDAKHATALIAREIAVHLGVVAVTMWTFSRFFDAEIEEDPRSSDLGKIRFGKVRFDPFSGLQQVLVLLARAYTGETKSAVTGEVYPIRGDYVYGRDGWDLITRFARNKLNPGWSSLANFIAGSDVLGEELDWKEADDWKREILSSFTPMNLADINDALQHEAGWGMTSAVTTAATLGIRTSVFDAPGEPISKVTKDRNKRKRESRNRRKNKSSEETDLQKLLRTGSVN